MEQPAPAPAPAKKGIKPVTIILIVLAVLIVCCVCFGLPLAYFCGDLLTGGTCGF